MLSEITASAIKNTKDINNKPPAAHQKTLKLLRNIETGDPLRFIHQGLTKKEGVWSISQFRCAKIGLNPYTVAMFILKLIYFTQNLDFHTQ